MLILDNFQDKKKKFKKNLKKWFMVGEYGSLTNKTTYVYVSSLSCAIFDFFLNVVHLRSLGFFL